VERNKTAAALIRRAIEKAKARIVLIATTYTIGVTQS
jgi:hypothetical protein